MHRQDGGIGQVDGFAAHLDGDCEAPMTVARMRCRVDQRQVGASAELRRERGRAAGRCRHIPRLVPKMYSETPPEKVNASGATVRRRSAVSFSAVPDPSSGSPRIWSAITAPAGAPAQGGSPDRRACGIAGDAKLFGDQARRIIHRVHWLPRRTPRAGRRRRRPPRSTRCRGR